jgi:hypothetical protein
VNGTPDSTLLQPLLDTLAARHGWLACAMVWVGTLRTAFKPLSGEVAGLLDRAIARVVETEDTADDLMLQRMFGSAWYRALAFALDLIASIKLPLKVPTPKKQNPEP